MEVNRTLVKVKGEGVPPWVQIFGFIQKTVRKKRDPLELNPFTCDTMAKAMETEKAQLEAIQKQVTNFLILHFPDARADPFTPVAKASVLEQNVLHLAMQHIEIHRSQITGHTYAELVKRLLFSFETQVAIRTTDRKNNSEDVRSRRMYKWQVAMAATSAEKRTTPIGTKTVYSPQMVLQ